MSLKTWIEEFYPVPASPEMSDADACKHGILKWSGRYKKNLKKHNVESTNFYIVERTPLNVVAFSADTCALCNKYYDYDYWSDVFKKSPCQNCPIVKSGNKACVTKGSAYLNSSKSDASPLPMLKVLRQALEDCEAHPEEFKNG